MYNTRLQPVTPAPGTRARGAFRAQNGGVSGGGLRSQGGVPLTGNPTGTLCVKALSGNIFGKISGAENKAKQWSRIGQNLVGAAQQLREQSPPDLLCTRMGTPP